VHYVVIDNIDSSNFDGTTARKYEKSITTEQLNWLVKDLSHVDKSTPVVVATHAQIFYPTTSGFKYDHDVTNTTTLFNILAGYEVHFVTGHTHQMFNVTPESAITGNHNFMNIIQALSALHGGGQAISPPAFISALMEHRVDMPSGMYPEPI